MEPPSAAESPPPIESYIASIEALLRAIIGAGGFDLQLSIRRRPSVPQDFEAPDIVVDLAGPDADLLLERNGAVLDALEYLVLRAVRLKEDLFGKITLDCRGWRRLRTEELKLTARVAAERVIETGDPFTLNPMSARERRIVHLALRELPEVRTLSEGFGPERKVVILPASPCGPTSPRSPRIRS